MWKLKENYGWSLKKNVLIWKHKIAYGQFVTYFYEDYLKTEKND